MSNEFEKKSNDRKTMDRPENKPFAFIPGSSRFPDLWLPGDPADNNTVYLG